MAVACGAAALATSSIPGPTTTTTRSTPAPSTAASTWRIMGWPATGCITFGRRERIRVPSPAARMIANVAEGPVSVVVIGKSTR